MKIVSHFPTQRHQTAREVELEKQLDQAYGTFMYCEAADFQSAEERDTAG